MGEGAGVFHELVGAQASHVADALDRARARIGRELLIAKYGEPFLETELEPVTAGHPVAAPVMEVFVADHLFDGVVVTIGGGGRAG